MQFGGKVCFRGPFPVSGWVVFCLLLPTGSLLSQTTISSGSAVSSTESSALFANVDPTDPITVGPRAAIGTDTAAEKVGKGVLGGLLGGSGDSRSKSDRPDTERDPTRKIDYVKIRDLGGALETEARAQMTDDGLLVSTRIDDAPGKGTFQSVFIQSCGGRRIYPGDYRIYKLWGEGGVSVSWSSSTTSNGRVIDQESGGLSGTMDDGVSHDDAVTGAAVWQQLGFNKAHHGARQIGSLFDISADELQRLGAVNLVVHTTLPSEDPVSTRAAYWSVSPGDDAEIMMEGADEHPDGWWGHCHRQPPALVASAALPASAMTENTDQPWDEINLVGIEAKVLTRPQPEQPE